jgi:predicted LPLAT superfamily acyltransferase
VLRRVTERRIEYLADLLGEAGVSPAAARRRARLLYAADLGLFQVGRALGEERPTDRELQALVREIQDAFVR